MLSARFRPFIRRTRIILRKVQVACRLIFGLIFKRRFPAAERLSYGNRMRSRFRRPQERTFRVDLTVHQLNSIPTIHRLLFVLWRARRAQPSEGRTPALAVESGNVIRWNVTENFTINIPSEATDPTMLQPAPLNLMLRSERRGRWVSPSYSAEGSLQVDLSEVAAVGSVSRNYLVQESLLNMTLKLTVRVTHQGGDKIFRTRTLPQISTPGLPQLSATPTAPTPPGTSSSTDLAVTLAPVEEDASASQAELTTLSPSSDFYPLPLMSPDVSNMGSLVPYPQPDRVPSSSLAVPSNTTQAPRNSASSLPKLTACSAPSTSSSILQALENDSAPTNFGEGADHSASSVLESGIPNPEVLQRHVYERIFQQRMRDQWPAYVTNSRVDACKAVNDLFTSVCAADGIVNTSPTAGEPTECQGEL